MYSMIVKWIRRRIFRFIETSPVRLVRPEEESKRIKFLRNIYLEDIRKIFSGKHGGIEYSKVISSIRVNKVWKQTESRRHESADKVIKDIARGSAMVFLDIGVSDGITSLELIKKLGDSFSLYYLTDICFFVGAIRKEKRTYVYSSSTGECFLCATDKFLFLKNVSSYLFPLNLIKNYIFSKSPKYDKKNTSIFNLLNPELAELAKNDRRILQIEWSVFKKWDHKKADFIKIANVLNRSYFSKNQIKKAIYNLKGILKNQGYLMVIENREVLKWTLFKKSDDHFLIVDSENSGSEIQELVLNGK